MSEARLKDPERDESETPGADKRTSPRNRCDWVTYCSPFAVRGAAGGKEPQWEGQAEDLSQGGIRVNVERRFEPGTLLFVAVPERDEETPRRVLATVVHVRSTESGGWSLGCRFVSPLDQEEVDDLSSLELPHFDN